MTGLTPVCIRVKTPPMRQAAGADRNVQRGPLHLGHAKQTLPSLLSMLQVASKNPFDDSLPYSRAVFSGLAAYSRDATLLWGLMWLCTMEYSQPKESD